MAGGYTPPSSIGSSRSGKSRNNPFPAGLVAICVLGGAVLAVGVSARMMKPGSAAATDTAPAAVAAAGDDATFQVATADTPAASQDIAAVAGQRDPATGFRMTETPEMVNSADEEAAVLPEGAPGEPVSAEAQPPVDTGGERLFGPAAAPPAPKLAEAAPPPVAAPSPTARTPTAPAKTASVTAPAAPPARPPEPTLNAPPPVVAAAAPAASTGELAQGDADFDAEPVKLCRLEPEDGEQVVHVREGEHLASVAKRLVPYDRRTAKTLLLARNGVCLDNASRRLELADGRTLVGRDLVFPGDRLVVPAELVSMVTGDY